VFGKKQNVGVTKRVDSSYQEKEEGEGGRASKGKKRETEEKVDREGEEGGIARASKGERRKGVEKTIVMYM